MADELESLIGHKLLGYQEHLENSIELQFEGGISVEFGATVSFPHGGGEPEDADVELQYAVRRTDGTQEH